MIRHVIEHYKDFYFPADRHDLLVEHIHQMEQWCDENTVGAFDWRDGAFWFESEEDYTMFLLRWT